MGAPDGQIWLSEPHPGSARELACGDLYEKDIKFLNSFFKEVKGQIPFLLAALRILLQQTATGALKK